MVSEPNDLAGDLTGDRAPDLPGDLAADLAADRSGKLATVLASIPEWTGRAVRVQPLGGGLSNFNYVASVDGTRYVVKVPTREMDEFGLAIGLADLFANTVAAGKAGVGARVLHARPDIPAMVLEYIDGRTLATPDLCDAAYIPRIGAAIATLHADSAPFANTLQIWDFLDRYLAQVSAHQLPTPHNLLASLDHIRAIQHVLTATAMAPVPSHNDLLPLNLMDDGQIRLIDYDFSGQSDPCFDLGDVAMEGSYDAAQLETLCGAYAAQIGRPETVAQLTHRARLFGIAAQYTWSLLFVGMDGLLGEKPDADFDYFQEAVDRWEWVAARLADPALAHSIDVLSRTRPTYSRGDERS
jgi:thiamine kinase-like enzyme